MTSSNDKAHARRERFLDRFPLSEFELDRLLLFLEYSSLNKETELPLSELCQRVGAEESDQQDGSAAAALEYIEECMLPECSKLFHSVSGSVVVVGCDDDENQSEWEFLEGMVSLLGRRGTRFPMQFIYDAVASHTSSGQADVSSLIGFVYRLLLAAFQLKNPNTTTNKMLQLEPPEAWMLSLSHSAGATGTLEISRAAWVEWVTWTAPEICRSLSTFFHYALFSAKHPFRTNSLQPFMLPQPDRDVTFWKHAHDPIPIALGCISSALGGKWHRLYSSDLDGLSFPTFKNSLLGYAGPTTILIRTTRMALFGFYTDCPWKESKWFGEGHDSFLFRLDPVLGVYTPTGEGNGRHMYLSSSAPVFTNSLKGLAIGGIDDDTPRIHLNTSLENCKACSVDTAFADGPILGTDDESFFDVDAIEVWAVNVSEMEFVKNMESGQRHEATREQARIRVAKVDPAHFLEDFQNGAIPTKLYSHRSDSRGRHDFVVDEATGGYYIEDKTPSPRAPRKRNDS